MTEPGRGSTRKGSNKPSCKAGRRIVVLFDDETFEEVRKRAVAQRQSFAAAVRELVEFGLEDVKS